MGIKDFNTSYANYPNQANNKGPSMDQIYANQSNTTNIKEVEEVGVDTEIKRDPDSDPNWQLDDVPDTNSGADPYGTYLAQKLTGQTMSKENMKLLQESGVSEFGQQKGLGRIWSQLLGESRGAYYERKLKKSQQRQKQADFSAQKVLDSQQKVIDKQQRDTGVINKGDYTNADGTLDMDNYNAAMTNARKAGIQSGQTPIAPDRPDVSVESEDEFFDEDITIDEGPQSKIKSTKGFLQRLIPGGKTGYQDTMDDFGEWDDPPPLPKDIREYKSTDVSEPYPNMNENQITGITPKNAGQNQIDQYDISKQITDGVDVSQNILNTALENQKKKTNQNITLNQQDVDPTLLQNQKDHLANKQANRQVDEEDAAWRKTLVRNNQGYLVDPNNNNEIIEEPDSNTSTENLQGNPTYTKDFQGPPKPRIGQSSEPESFDPSITPTQPDKPIGQTDALPENQPDFVNRKLHEEVAQHKITQDEYIDLRKKQIKAQTPITQEYLNSSDTVKQLQGLLPQDSYDSSNPTNEYTKSFNPQTDANEPQDRPDIGQTDELPEPPIGQTSASPVTDAYNKLGPKAKQLTKSTMKSLGDWVSVYSPASDANNPEKITSDMLQMTGYSADTNFWDMDSSKIADAQTQLEGGTGVKKNKQGELWHNPGNLKFAGQPGAHEDPSTGFAVFDSAATGRAAHIRQIEKDQGRAKDNSQSNDSQNNSIFLQSNPINDAWSDTMFKET